MAEVVLLPHNEVAHDKLVNCLKTNQVATINHATGTGKSFIILKYLYENRNKRILYLAPTYPIIEQIKNQHTKELGIDINEFTKFDSMIYRTLLDLDMEELASQYDIIVLDEYHRCGSLKWGKKIKQLKDIICNKYKNTKIIGTTATEIRYLDGERNMKDILFDGVEASRLTLADAIVQGILPVPYYINFDFDVFDEINTLKSRVSKIIVNKKSKEKLLNELECLENKFKKALYESETIKKYIKSNGKYLVFSSNKAQIEKDKERILNFFQGNDVDEYIVTSDMEHDKNMDTLSEFRNASNDKLSILYSIDILSEGVHVKDVYAEFMCRRTTSPTKYFQQIGRILSYSQRKKQVVVFDLANNIKQHKAIYTLYNEVAEKAKELIERDPTNKDMYLEIISKFKVIDNFSKIYSEFGVLKEELSKSNLINKLLTDDIELLESGVKLSAVQLYSIQLEIKKYYNFITLDLFKRMKEKNDILNIKLFEIDTSEFETALKGFPTLYDSVYKKYRKLFDDVSDFVDNNDRLPSLFSEDKKEFALAKDLYKYFYKLNNNQKKFIKEYANGELSILEKISYGIEDENCNGLIDEIKYVLNFKIPISNNIIFKLRVLDFLSKYKNIPELINKIKINNIKYNIYEIDNGEELLDISKYIYTAVGEKSEIMSSTIEDLEKKIEEYGFDETVDYIYYLTLDFIQKYNRKPSFKNNYTIGIKKGKNGPDIKKENYLYMANIVLDKTFSENGYKQKINELCKFPQTSIIKKLIKFMEQNEYQLPIKNINDDNETRLAIMYSKIKNKLTSENEHLFQPYLDKFEEAKKNFLAKIDIFDYNSYQRIINSLEYRRFYQYLLPEERMIFVLYSDMNDVIGYMNINGDLPKIDTTNPKEKKLLKKLDKISEYYPTKVEEFFSYYRNLESEKTQKFMVEFEKFLMGSKKLDDDALKRLKKDYIMFRDRFTEQEKSQVILKNLFELIVKFINENNYLLPSIDSKDSYENFLAFLYDEYKKNFSDNEKNILDLYSEKLLLNKAQKLNELIDFVKNNIRIPRKDVENERDLILYIEQLYPYYSQSEKKIIDTLMKIEDIINFIISNNYELPCNSKFDKNEIELRKIYVNMKKIFNSDEDMIFDRFREQFYISKQQFIENYIQFLKENKRYPVIIDDNEKHLVYSFDRWNLYFTSEEKIMIRSIKISKMKTMQRLFELDNKKI